MKFKEYRFLIYSDLYRITGQANIRSLVWHIIWGEAFKYNFWMRSCAYTGRHALLKFSIYPIAKFLLRRLRYKLSISISADTKIGSGFYIGHFGGIVVNAKAIIGKNCNISQCVTLGQTNRGKNKGNPILGDNIYIGPGAKIIGAIKIGNNVAIGANCVVTKDIPDNAVVAGIPGKVISQEGSKGYVNNTDYEDKISQEFY
ncbi:MAG: serine acetyltransferase [Candidatus Contendobacter odensis]|uniref:Serine acetyltransferase n=1 Tax=Candidatus Contendibacter odensensis TaxID=1400860 RepID=A0A2G6PE92_9GAMM|nr:MAG: serine acetyltransferase [Candidatus Contendobacter odensis]